jgi:hypothetical protein
MMNEHIEQKLRALTCEGCRSGRHPAGVKLTDPCFSKHAELLPLIDAVRTAEIKAAAEIADETIHEGGPRCKIVAKYTRRAILARLSPYSQAALDAEIERAVKPLREAIVEAAIPLEVIAANIRAGHLRELSPDVRQAVLNATALIQDALRPQTGAEEGT